jgi:aromatic-L-amino-acid decarboxylase
MWLHVDGALRSARDSGAPEIAPRLAGIEAADSLAFDFHKWGQVPYDAGFVLVRDGELHRKAFASPAAYLEREPAGWPPGRLGRAIWGRIFRADSGRSKPGSR